MAGAFETSAAAGGLGAVVLLVNPAFDMAARKALLVRPIPLIAEGMLWALLGGAMFLFPVAVVVLALVQPRNSHGRALAMGLFSFFRFSSSTFLVASAGRFCCDPCLAPRSCQPLGAREIGAQSNVLVHDSEILRR